MRLWMSQNHTAFYLGGYMKKTLCVAALLALTGCASWGPYGAIYTEVKVPSGDLEVASETTPATRSGTAMCKSILGLVGLGDCSVDTARRNGSITRISSVQWDVMNILGIYAEYTTHVLGN